MFSQFFGHYLLNNSIVTSAQLNEAMVKKSETRVKLGVLAINAGYMTAEQVEQVHAQQAKIDKRIGDISVDMGFLTESQVTELLNSQRPAHLLLGQTLVDLDYITNSQFESALLDYKKKFELEDADFIQENVAKSRSIIGSFLGLSGFQNRDFSIDYISLVFKSITRFISDDFTPADPINVEKMECDVLVTQKIKGSFNASTAITCNADALVAFAAKFAKEDITQPDEYAEAVMSEFLNLHNGLFAVNISAERGVELSLEPQEVSKNVVLEPRGICVALPLSFTFGVVNFILTLG